MAWEEVAYEVLGAPAPSVVVNVSGFQFYRVSVYVVSDSTEKQVLIRMNADGGSNYTAQSLTSNVTNVTAARGGATGVIGTRNPLDPSQGTSLSMQVIIAKPAAGAKGQAVVAAGYPAGAPANNGVQLNLVGAEWNNTADSITSISIVASAGNFAAGTSILVEGLAT